MCMGQSRSQTVYQKDTDHGVHLQICGLLDVTTSDGGIISELASETQRGGREDLSPSDRMMRSPQESRCNHTGAVTPSHEMDNQSALSSDGSPWERLTPESVNGIDQIEYSEDIVAGSQIQSVGQVTTSTSHMPYTGTNVQTSRWACASTGADIEETLAAELPGQGRGSRISMHCVTPEAVVCTPQTLHADHPLQPAVPILIDALIEKFRFQPSEKSTKRMSILREGQGRKKIRLSCPEDYMDVHQASDPEDFDTVVIEHTGKRANSLPCPFYIRDKRTHRECLTRYQLRNIEDVREHLWGVHQRPIYCPSCGKTFSQVGDCDSHIRSRTCNHQMSNLPTFDGITISHMQKLARQAELSLSVEDHWLGVWAIVFPDAQRPQSWLFSTDEESRVCALRDFWSSHGQNIVESSLQAQAVQAPAMSHQDENLAALYNTVLNGAIDKVLDAGGCM